MPDPIHPVGYPIDAHPVRPGSSDALTARTIDATVHPPLRRAQETAATLVPRVAQAAAPLREPMVLGTIAAALTFILIARHMRYRPSAIALGAALVLALSSFYPMQRELVVVSSTGAKPITPTPRTLSREASARVGRRLYTGDGQYEPAQPIEEPTQVIVEGPSPPDEPMMPAMPTMPTYDGVPVDPRQWVPPELVERVPEISRDVMRSAERALRENQQMRQLMARLRYQIREEARRQRWRRMTTRRHAAPEDLESIGMVFTPY
jgi:hypothetical protein